MKNVIFISQILKMALHNKIWSSKSGSFLQPAWYSHPVRHRWEARTAAGTTSDYTGVWFQLVLLLSSLVFSRKLNWFYLGWVSFSAVKSYKRWYRERSPCAFGSCPALSAVYSWHHFWKLFSSLLKLLHFKERFWYQSSDISRTTAGKPSDGRFKLFSFPYRFSRVLFCLLPGLSKTGTLGKTEAFLGVGVKVWAAKPPSLTNIYARVPVTLASWGFCRKWDNNDVPITHKVQRGEVDLGSELECSAVFSFISERLLDDEWNTARLITFLTIKFQRLIH